VASIAPICRRFTAEVAQHAALARRATTSAPNAEDSPMSRFATAASSSA